MKNKRERLEKENDRRRFQRSYETVKKRGVLKEFNVNKGAQAAISPGC